MKRLVIALSVIFTLSALTSVAAALGMQRMPDRVLPLLGQAPPAMIVTPPVAWTPSPVPLTPTPASDTYVSPYKTAGTLSPSMRAKAEADPAVPPPGQMTVQTPLPVEPVNTDADAGASAPATPAPRPAPEQPPEMDLDTNANERPDGTDSPVEGEEEHIEGTDKPEAIVVAKATKELLPDFGGLPVLVNRDNILPRGYVPELAVVPGTYYQLTPETLTAYTLLMDDARKAGHNKLRLQSAYRSFDTQNGLFERKIQKFKGQYGDKAREKAAQIVAPPGQSEHQLGQAVDIANGSLVQSFGETPAGKWMADNAHYYGFILRYPKDKTPITGILYEPWHFRYVGVEAATVIYENEWTLEEFFQNHEDAQEEELGAAA